MPISRKFRYIATGAHKSSLHDADFSIQVLWVISGEGSTGPCKLVPMYALRACAVLDFVAARSGHNTDQEAKNHFSTRMSSTSKPIFGTEVMRIRAPALVEFELLCSSSRCKPAPGDSAGKSELGPAGGVPRPNPRKLVGENLSKLIGPHAGTSPPTAPRSHRNQLSHQNKPRGLALRPTSPRTPDDGRPYRRLPAALPARIFGFCVLRMCMRTPGDSAGKSRLVSAVNTCPNMFAQMTCRECR